MADLTNSEIRKILKSYGEEIGPVTATSRNIYLKKIEDFKKSKIQPTKSIRKSETIFTDKSNFSSSKANVTSPITPSNMLSINGNGNHGKKSHLDASSETQTSFGTPLYAYKRTEPRFNQIDNRSSRYNESYSSLDSDLQIIAEDNYRKEIKGQNLSPIHYMKGADSNCYRLSDYSPIKYNNKIYTKPNPVQANSSNNTKKWYNGSFGTISNYFTSRKDSEDLMDISDCDLSDNEGNLMTRLRRNYFKKTGTSDVDTTKIKSKSSRKTESSFINWNQLPNILLGIVIIFSVLLFLSYILMKNRYSNMELEIAMDGLTDKIGTKDRFTVEEIPQLKNYLAKLYDILSEYSGEKTCEFLPDKRLSFTKARDILNHKLKREKSEMISEGNWSQLMKMVILLPRDKLNIAGYNNDNEIVGVDGLPEHITYLEGLIPKLSMFCRLKMFSVNILNGIFYFLCVIVVIVLVLITGYFLNLYRLKRKQITEKRINELREIVSCISSLLQDQLRQAEFSATSDKYLTITKIRSILQQTYPKLRDKQFWEDLKKFMYKTEPLIELKETIAHGEILEWKSHLGWQGSAVQSDCQVKFEKGPTECLKIRNMDLINFDESGENYLRREVMNRIKDAGEIKDIQFLRKGSKVIVYVLCSSREVAGRAFRKVNANYFNGNLLNVKFIRLDKYLERFPESKIYVK